jgi:cephalosporin-C deacetylase
MSADDWPLEQLRDYRPERDEPADLDAFWRETLSMSRELAVAPVFADVETSLRAVRVQDVTFSGFAGQPIRAWLITPVAASRPLPTIVEFVAYGGGRSMPFAWLHWASAGYAHFVMDTRGQGSAWSPGDTPDVDADPGGGQYPGFVTRGIERPASWYYRRLVTDAVRAVDAARDHPLVDPRQVVVTGKSQGGGVALAVAGLAPDLAAAMVDVPFLCHWRRAIEVTDNDPYHELTAYLAVHRSRADAVIETLSYVDGLNFATRASSPALFSVGLMDDICPPSTVFAAFNHYAGPKEIRVWRFNGHEAGELDQQIERYAFLERLGIAPD